MVTAITAITITNTSQTSPDPPLTTKRLLCKTAVAEAFKLFTEESLIVLNIVFAAKSNPVLIRKISRNQIKGIRV